MKKAYLVDVNLKIRVVVADHIDPEGEEFGEAVHQSVEKRMKEEGISFINEGIDDYTDDKENPYDSEYDDQKETQYKVHCSISCCSVGLISKHFKFISNNMKKDHIIITDPGDEVESVLAGGGTIKNQYA